MIAPVIPLDVLGARPAFDLAGPMPTGTTVLEASAGTGKTYTIAALAVRAVAEGHARLTELMLVTFGREATRELRDRVRDRFTTTAAALADPSAITDELERRLAGGDGAGPDEVAARRARLVHALAHFDAMTIATTHEFCSRMLDGLGLVGDADRDAVFVEEVDDLVVEVVDDFYVRKYAAPGARRADLTRAQALAVGRRAVGDPGAVLVPEPVPGAPEDQSTAAVRRRFGVAVRDELDRRKRRGRLYTYDDMLTRLDEALGDPALGEAACRRLRDRYRVVIVDEFQDTDPTQWRILRRAFHGHASLTVIGDPKQAIYAFRGADVISYLEAKTVAGTDATLRTNWRSDAGLLEAIDAVFSRAALGSTDIRVDRVEAHHQGSRLAGAPVDTPLRLRVVPRAGLPATEKTGLPKVPGMRARVAADVAADIAGLLDAGATWNGRALRPGDIAVLIRKTPQDDLVRDALEAAGVPVVLGSTESVFGSAGAQEWLTLLEALEQPHRPPRVRSAALTAFLGRRPVDLDTHGEKVLDEDGARLRAWGHVLREKGVAALLEEITGGGLAERLLAGTDGERRLTDLRHVGQALHAAATESHLGLVAMVEWLRRRIAEAGREFGLERSRRLESDADAVQVITVHRGKGLEYPVVYVPFGWDRNVGDPEFALHHDDEDRRVLAVGGEGDPGWNEHVERHHREEAGEDLRLLYVALTRAQSQVVAWWAPSTTTRCSPLHRLLFGRPDGGWLGTEPRPGYKVRDDTTSLEWLRGLTSLTPEIAVEQAPTDPRAPDRTRRDDEQDPPPLAAARFERALDLAWRRTSYSALTAAAHGAGEHRDARTAEPEVPTTEDEAEIDAVATPVDETLAMPSPMASLPLGTGFGTLVHAVLESTDPTAADLPAELHARAAEALAFRPAAGVEPGALAEALVPVLETPLGPDADARRLRDVDPADRLTELDFELPLAGGDTPRDAPVDLGLVERLLRRHLPADDPLHAYPDVLAGLGGAPLRGYLTGSIDAVLRDTHGRHVIVDYKTNWLGPVDDALTAAYYRPDALRDAMIAAHYPLQALLYGVALHRFLRWRLRGYEPERHLGGSLYLFLRGMCGPATPVADGGRCGVFAWRPPAALTVDLSDALDGGGA